MTVVNSKSISGITSITTPSGSDDLLTIHNNNGTERFRVQSDKVMSSLDFKPDGNNTRDLGASGTKWKDAYIGTLRADVGVVTAFSGDLNIDDKIVHIGDTNTAIRFPAADTITAETGGTERYRITSDGKFVGGPLANGHSTARCAAGGLDLRAGQGGAGFPSIKIGADSGTANATTLSNSTRKQARIGCASYHNSYDFATFLYFDSDTSTNELNIGGGTGHGYAATNISLWTAANNTTSTGTERIRINSGGTVNIPAGITLGETVSSTDASNTLDDYEEGTFTVTMANGVTLHSTNDLLSYIKVGHLVHVTGVVRINSGNSSSDIAITNMPFATVNASEQAGNAIGSVSIYDINMNSGYSQVICVMNPNSTQLNVVLQTQSGGQQIGMDAADNAYIGVSICYRAA